jgi:hypothetical protein
MTWTGSSCEAASHDNDEPTCTGDGYEWLSWIPSARWHPDTTEDCCGNQAEYHIIAEDYGSVLDGALQTIETPTGAPS